MTCTASSRRSQRSFTEGKVQPKAVCSRSNQAAPIPTFMRPPLMSSMVAIILATRAGLRYVLPVTSVPRRTRSVVAARPARRA